MPPPQSRVIKKKKGEGERVRKCCFSQTGSFSQSHDQERGPETDHVVLKEGDEGGGKGGREKSLLFYSKEETRFLRWQRKNNAFQQEPGGRFNSRRQRGERGGRRIQEGGVNERNPAHTRGKTRKGIVASHHKKEDRRGKLR